jgi:hypothetical protein
VILHFTHISLQYLHSVASSKPEEVGSLGSEHRRPSYEEDTFCSRVLLASFATLAASGSFDSPKRIQPKYASAGGFFPPRLPGRLSCFVLVMDASAVALPGDLPHCLSRLLCSGEGAGLQPRVVPVSVTSAAALQSPSPARRGYRIAGARTSWYWY